MTEHTDLPWDALVQRAEAEFTQEVGADIATVVKIGLEAYANAYA